jgi:hypothetical protein
MEKFLSLFTIDGSARKKKKKNERSRENSRKNMEVRSE